MFTVNFLRAGTSGFAFSESIELLIEDEENRDEGKIFPKNSDILGVAFQFSRK